GGKNHWISGIFLQSEQKNRNGRIYPKSILAKQVERYTNEAIVNKRAIGELNHPSHPEPNPERASHLITSLKESGNDWVGRAKVLNTPMGNIVKGLLDDGVQLGVSSRGLGSLKESNGLKVVQEDYYLSTIDIVSNPSAPAAFVNGLMEGVEWIWENDSLIQRKLEVIKEKIEKIIKPSEKDLCEMFELYINGLR
ncbi:MAG: primosomal protein, partial [Deltaproteobacteria bacterium]